MTPAEAFNDLKRAVNLKYYVGPAKIKLIQDACLAASALSAIPKVTLENVLNAEEPKAAKPKKKIVKPTKKEVSE